MTTLDVPAPRAAFDRLVERLADGDEIDAGQVITVLAANGRTAADLELAIDQFVAEHELHRMADDGGPLTA